MKGITRKRRNVYINCLDEVECYYYGLFAIYEIANMLFQTKH